MVPTSVTPQISHLKRRTALTTRRQSIPPSGSAPPAHSVAKAGGAGDAITGGVEPDPGGSGRWLIVIGSVPLQVAGGVALQGGLASRKRCGKTDTAPCTQ